jgi:hypothetical protein
LNGQWYHRIGPPVAQIKPGESYDAATAKPVGIRQFNPGRPVYKPEYVAKVKDLDERQVLTDPAWHCRPPGVPRVGPPQKIVQTAKELVFMYDDRTATSSGSSDERQHRMISILCMALGRPMGGDTLVVA